MKKTKIIVSILLIVCALFAFVACGKLPNGDDAGNNNTTGGGDNGNGEVDNSAYQVDEATWEEIFTDENARLIDNVSYTYTFISQTETITASSKVLYSQYENMLLLECYEDYSSTPTTLTDKELKVYNEENVDIYTWNGDVVTKTTTTTQLDGGIEQYQFLDMSSLYSDLTTMYASATFDETTMSYIFEINVGSGETLVVNLHFENDKLTCCRYTNKYNNIGEYGKEDVTKIIEWNIGSVPEIEIPQID